MTRFSRLAALCCLTLAATACDPTGGIKDVDHWLKQRANPETKEQAEKALEHLKGYYIDQLNDPIGRNKAFDSLALMTDDPSLLKVFMDLYEKDPDLRMRVLSVAPKFRDKSIGPRFVQDLKQPSSASEAAKQNPLNRKIIDALVVLDYREASDKIIEFLESKDPFVVSSACDAMTKWKNPKSYEKLIAVMQNSKEFTTKKKVIEAVGASGRSEAVQVLMTAMYEYNGKLYDAASFGLFKIGDAAVPPMLDALQGKNAGLTEFATKNKLSPGIVEAKIAEVLGDFHDPRVVDPLLAMADALHKGHLNHTVNRIQGNAMVFAIYSASITQDPKVVPQIVKMLTDEHDPTITKSLGDALVFVGDPAQADLLLKIAGNDKEEYVDVNSFAFEAAGRLDDGTRLDQATAIANAVKKRAMDMGKFADEKAMLASVNQVRELVKQFNKTTDPAKRNELEKQINEGSKVGDQVSLYKKMNEVLEAFKAAKECQKDMACWKKKLAEGPRYSRDRAAWAFARHGTGADAAALLEVMGKTTVEAESLKKSKEDKDKERLMEIDGLRQQMFWALRFMVNKKDVAKAAVPALEKFLETETRNKESVERVLVLARRRAA